MTTSERSEVKLWLATTVRRYFLIPADVALPAGPESLTTVTGAAACLADLSQLTAYEVDRAQATEWLRGRWKHGVQQLFAGPAVEPVEPSPPPSEPGPGLALVAALAGASPEVLATDRAALASALDTVGARVRTLWAGAVTRDPGDVQVARAEAAALTAELRANGLPVGDLGAVVDMLQALRSPRGASELRRASGWLERLAERIEGAKPDDPHLSREGRSPSFSGDERDDD